ncbi:MSP domain-containing protein [Oryctes borbonicus]|uniref:MSP domain-containing protein n=1 Tax=Oryctes borbonicus TaxID=1629725 RepID=A0A0T6BET0_9SCAR|nr:MSP domain-containing protein [Oryctes borbonicus]
MAKPDQVLIIEPQNELRFKGPFNVPVTSYMKLTNPSEKKVMFKIKTTAPKKYCVRPNSGSLDSNASVEIAICLQPFIFDPTEKNKHKFMVQTVFAPDGDLSADQIWKDVFPEKIMDSKLKCVFEMPDEQKEAQEEPVKTSPKAAIQQTATINIEAELQKAAAEVQQLREEESSLRQENLRLKEELLRLNNTAGVRQPITNKYSPAAVQNPNNPMFYLALSVALAVFGFILGKFLL